MQVVGWKLTWNYRITLGIEDHTSLLFGYVSRKGMGLFSRSGAVPQTLWYLLRNLDRSSNQKPSGVPRKGVTTH